MKANSRKKLVLTSTILTLIGLFAVLIFVTRQKNTTVVSNRADCSPNRLYFSNGTSLDKKPLQGWVETRSEDDTNITFSKGLYSLSLLPANRSQSNGNIFWEHYGLCFFPDTPGYQNRQTYGEVVGAFEIPEYTELTLQDGALIRHGKAVFSTQTKMDASEIVCYKSALPSATEFGNDSIGYITINYPPNNPTPNLLTEIDQILSSLQTHTDTLCAD